MFNLLLASGTRSLFERLLSRRHVREVVGAADDDALGAPAAADVHGIRRAVARAGWGRRSRPWRCRGRRRRTRRSGTSEAARAARRCAFGPRSRGGSGGGSSSAASRYDAMAAQATRGAARGRPSGDRGVVLPLAGAVVARSAGRGMSRRSCARWRARRDFARCSSWASRSGWRSGFPWSPRARRARPTRRVVVSHRRLRVCADAARARCRTGTASGSTAPLPRSTSPRRCRCRA